jgi:hypothetical protein
MRIRIPNTGFRFYSYQGGGLCLQGRGGLGRGISTRPGKRGGEEGEHPAQQGLARRLLTGFISI